MAKEFQEQDLAQLPPELQQVVRDAMAQGATFGEAMDYVEQFVPQVQGEVQDTGQEGMQGEMSQDMQGQGPMMMQGQPPMQSQQDPLAQIMAMLPPELQQVFQDPAVQQALMQMLQQGIPPDQAVEQIIQMLQGAPQQPQPQGVGAGFVSPAQQGQMPVPPDQQAAMMGF